MWFVCAQDGVKICLCEICTDSDDKDGDDDMFDSDSIQSQVEFMCKLMNNTTKIYNARIVTH